MNPLFSIIIPTFNRAERLKKTIQSLIEQTCDDWELIVVDDGGQDDTKSVVDDFKDDRIHYFWKENQERGAARNFGLSKSKGQIINFFDSDDLMYPHHLERAKAHFETHAKTEILCFPWDYYNAEGKKVNTRTDFDKDLNTIIKKKNFIHLNGGFIKRDLLGDTPFIPDRKFNICEDWYFYLKLSLQHKLVGINEPSFKYILHPDSTMSQMSSASFEVAVEYFHQLMAEERALDKFRKVILQELYSMLSLAYALEGKRSQSIRYFCKATAKKPFAAFSKRTLGIMKNLLNAKRRS